MKIPTAQLYPKLTPEVFADTLRSCGMLPRGARVVVETDPEGAAPGKVCVSIEYPVVDGEGNRRVGGAGSDPLGPAAEVDIVVRTRSISSR